MSLSLAISPCPNDTFVFHALVHGLVPGAPPVDVTYADVDITNTAAQRAAFDLVKVSYAALPGLEEEYTLLPCGGALGRGCGPLLLVGEDTADGGEPDLTETTVAIPGELTTAYLLFRLWSGGAARVKVVPFHEIMPGVAAGRFGAGLVIHEARFTYPQYGLRALVDLGAWWEADTGLPIPLGAILARNRTVDPERAAEWVRASLRAAWADPDASREYVRQHAQEMDPAVMDQHIALYVNEFTAELGEEGRAAVDTLLRRSAALG